MKQLYILLGFLIVPFLIMAQNRASDSLTLVSIYQSLDGDSWPNNDNWLSDQPLEEWKNVRMTNDRVSKLEIRSTASANTAGDFPIQVLDLTELKTFELSSVSINGPIPESLKELTKLDRLVFKSCKLTGDVPPIFDQMVNLRTLVLTGNELTGQLPALHQDMYLVYIGRNQFSGHIPESWTGNEMVNLQIDNNNLTGNYDILNTCPNLNSLLLSDNDWDEHTLPLWIDDIPNLDRFSCDGCNIVGEIPSELNFAAQENYSGMFLSDNDLSGDISILFNNPEYGQNLFLRARNNNFSGELPVHKIVSFNELDVYNNHYTSMTSPQQGVEYTLDILYNDFTYEGLAPVQEFIALDSIIGIKYWNQNAIGDIDTLIFTSSTSITLTSGDDYPNTSYQWTKSGQEIEGGTESELLLDITDNSDAGWYRCKLSNPDFPELDLQTSGITIEVNIATSMVNTLVDNLNISPNPVHDILNVTGIENSNYQYSISSISGNIISNGLSDGNIDVSLLGKGAYILSVTTGNNTAHKKFIKF